MIRPEPVALLMAALLASACDRRAANDRTDGIVTPGSSGSVPTREGGSAEGKSQSTQAAESRSVSPAPDVGDVVLEKKDIMVNGEAACALTVRYGHGPKQFVTWNGERCGQILISLSSIEDLKQIGQDGKLGSDALEELANLPHRRALYIEGSHSSSLYPENGWGRVYEVPLAD